MLTVIPEQEEEEAHVQRFLCCRDISAGGFSLPERRDDGIERLDGRFSRGNGNGDP